MTAIRVGLAGFGYSAETFHLPFINCSSDLKLTAIYQRSPSPAPGSTKRHCTVIYPECKHYSTINEFIADNDIDLVVIATPDDIHAELTIKALRAGKHGQCGSGGRKLDDLR